MTEEILPASDDAEHYRRLERDWQESVGRHLLDVPHEAPGSAIVFEAQFDRIADELALSETGAIVEIGCGKGHLLEHLRRRSGPRGPRLIGVDLSSAVHAVRERGLCGLQGDGERLPFDDASLSGVIYDGALHHLIDYEEGLRDAFRALRPGGKLVIFEPVSSPFSRLVHKLLDPIVFTKVEYESPIDQHYKDDFREARIRGVLDELGMEHTICRTDFLAYPLTGCYAGSFASRFRGLMRALLTVEKIARAIPGVRRIADAMSWRFLLIARRAA